MIDKIVNLLNSGKSGKLGNIKIKHCNSKTTRYSYLYINEDKVLSLKYTPSGLPKVLDAVDSVLINSIIEAIKVTKGVTLPTIKCIDRDKLVSAFVGQTACIEGDFTVSTERVGDETVTKLHILHKQVASVRSSNSYTQFNIRLDKIADGAFLELLLATIFPNDWKRILWSNEERVGTFNNTIFLGEAISTWMTLFKVKYDFINKSKGEISETTSEPNQNQKQEHYPKDQSLFLIADTIGLNVWEMDIFRRLYRCRKKGEFIKDLGKLIDTIDLYITETAGKPIEDVERNKISEYLRLHSSFSLSNKLCLNSWESNIFALICQCRVSGSFELDLNKAKITAQNYLREYSQTK